LLIAGYLIGVGIVRTVGEVPVLAQGNKPRMVGLTLFNLISGIALLARTWWARRVALATLVVSTLDFAISAVHLMHWGASRYATGLLIVLALVLLNAVMFGLLARRSARESFPIRPAPDRPNKSAPPNGGPAERIGSSGVSGRPPSVT
jgi:hypothetical protein